jgi:hypothetical protein
VVYKHTGKLYGKKAKRNNKEIYKEILEHNNASTPNQHSLSEIAINMALLL